MRDPGRSWGVLYVRGVAEVLTSASEEHHKSIELQASKEKIELHGATSAAVL
jgi:hypothetical protein